MVPNIQNGTLGYYLSCVFLLLLLLLLLWWTRKDILIIIILLLLLDVDLCVFLFIVFALTFGSAYGTVREGLTYFLSFNSLIKRPCICTYTPPLATFFLHTTLLLTSPHLSIGRNRRCCCCCCLGGFHREQYTTPHTERRTNGTTLKKALISSSLSLSPKPPPPLLSLSLPPLSLSRPGTPPRPGRNCFCHGNNTGYDQGRPDDKSKR